MSKKPKTSRHRVPTEYVRPADPIDDRYQAEIDRSVSRLTKKYEAARKRLEAAEARAEKLEKAKNLKLAQQKELRDLQKVIDERRRELHELEVLMMPGNYAPVGHRPAPVGSRKTL